MERTSPLRAVARVGVRRVFDWIIGGIGAVLRVTHRTPPWPDQIRSILVVRVDLLGDVLFTMPAVQALRKRYPDARITMITLQYTAPLARLYDTVDEVLAVDTNRIRTLKGLFNANTWSNYMRTARLLRTCRYDLALSMSGRMGSLCAFLAGASRTVGYGTEAYRFLLTDPAPGRRYDVRAHEVSYDMALAARAGACTDAEGLHVPVPSDARCAVARKLGEHGIGPCDRVVLIHGGSGNGSAKRWPAASWGRFADRVAQETGSRVVLAGGPADLPVGQEIEAAAECPLVSLVGETTIPELVALVERADLVASGDSGPLHLAVALGRPLLAAYGPTDPAIYGPFKPTGPVRLHRRDLPCSPCYTGDLGTSECPLGHNLCMKLITVSEMVESAVALLATV